MFVSAWTTKSHLYDVVCVCAYGLVKLLGEKKNNWVQNLSNTRVLCIDHPHTHRWIPISVPPSIPKYPRMDKQNHLLLTYPSSLIAAIASVFFCGAFTCHTAKSSSLSSSELFYLRRDGQNHCCICVAVLSQEIFRGQCKGNEVMLYTTNHDVYTEIYTSIFLYAYYVDSFYCI